MKLISSIGVPAWASGFKLATSVCDSCQRSLTTRHQSAHNIGITMHDAWYCGASCFTAASAEIMAHLLRPGLEPANRAERMPLGLLLVSRGLLTKQQLRDANSESKESREEIGTLLIRRGVVNEKQVAAARAVQWGCPVCAVPADGIRGGVHLPPALNQACSAVPLHYGLATNQLLVGFVHSIDYGLLYAIEHILACKAQASFVTPSDFAVQVKVQGETGPEAPLMFDAMLTPAEMAGALCTAAVELEAHEAAIAKCKGYLWARVKRERAVKDLLFKTP